MKFVTHNDREIDVNGTFLVGEINADYNTLVSAFGEPAEGIDKIDVTWKIKFSDGTIATIYNYKDGKNYLGESGMATEKITNWHIGGKSSKAFSCVEEVLNNAPSVSISIDNFDITDKIGTLQSDVEWPMYSYDRPSYIFWNGVAKGLVKQGATMAEIKWWLQSKNSRWLLDRMSDKIEDMGLKWGKEVNLAEIRETIAREGVTKNP